MGLRVNTNVSALQAYGNLSANQNALEDAFGQLASGLRINKAADDAAGLSISQGLTSQINGLSQALTNVNDGINLAQIADGALGTVQDVLQRMRQLVVKAGNEGTQDSSSIAAIQDEIGALSTQLYNVASQTKFGQTNLLDGTYDRNFQVGANGGDTIPLDLSTISVRAVDLGATGLNIAPRGMGIHPGENPAAVLFSKDLHDAITLHGGAITPSDGLDELFNIYSGGAFYGSGVTVTSVEVAPPGRGGWILKNSGGEQVGTLTQNLDGTFNIMRDDGVGPAVLLKTVDPYLYEPAGWDLQAGLSKTVGNTGDVDGTVWDTLRAVLGSSSATFTFDPIGGTSNPSWAIKDASSAQRGTAELDSGTGIYLFRDMSGTIVSGLNPNLGAISGQLQSYSSSRATMDLDALDAAIAQVSASRSQIGAVQNQLTYTAENLQTAITNVTASRSNLTDADLAEQVTAMTQSQILSQAATTVLAQANSAPQAVLKLLG